MMRKSKYNYSSSIIIIRTSQREDTIYKNLCLIMLSEPGIEADTPFLDGCFDSWTALEQYPEMDKSRSACRWLEREEIKPWKSARINLNTAIFQP